MKQNKYDKIKSEFSEFFVWSRSANSECGKEIFRLKEDKVKDFFERLINHPELSKSFKLWTIIAFAGGCRVSETLELTKKNIDIKSKTIRKIRVLKKRNQVRFRDMPIPAYVIPFLTEVLFDYADNEKLFTSDRYYLHQQCQQFFNTRPHAFRHSRATHLIYLGLTHYEVKKLMDWNSVDMVAVYEHTTAYQVIDRVALLDVA